MFLYLDTTSGNEINLFLYDQVGRQVDSRTQAIDRDESEKLLVMIKNFLPQAKNIQGIVVVKGPRGRFSAIRSGVVAANLLAFAWDVPVVGIESGENVKSALKHLGEIKNFGEAVLPIYEKGPNIGE
ncbi:MAG: hypothetical protein A2445_03130 [Candidatus Jacksonbacteria bacterium RIFOXYC2_FULL_44_29]|nr:MAG: hypothetical protein UW45_C0002G0033 [Parcubacteria group bacterium GW2011_GWC2_44_22]OGY75203.1 MAG: hypothetical protein A2240_01210 [Candidatus Jacksonbacteria bacterium RIFOXYA2_FULL_43_12]OGY75879.1 MAG: hypothetical protein A2295_01060 [Candidatus Jacksonbacteria bacterium RIFOXYB2_FULL_44_15]OGY77652.1 MAG: hypothetical protein A2445_03130 [Candidatus Jacksonbacteria bacterium RIFOXYC2_FULL_44_29]OGY79539.1 MAG: hypothetical protein A2550_02215 [Candidatus Jacksonbacteria bacteri